MKHIGETIKAIIEAKRLQKNRVAASSSITPTYLSAIMHKESIDCALLERICKAIGVHPSEFFDESLANNYTVSDVSASAFLGAATVNISQGEVAALKQLLEEKERTIQILMSASGLKESVDEGTLQGQ